MMKKYLFLFIVISILYCIWSFFVPVKYDFYLFQSSLGKNQEIIYEIEHGASLKKIILDLKKKKLIRKYFPYTVFLRWRTLKAGEYSLSFNKNPYFMFNQFSKGAVLTYDITFPEGTNMFEMADMLESKNLISKKRFLDLSMNPDFVFSLLGERLESLEGYLYPDTYQVTKGIKAEKLLQLMVDEFLKVYKKIEPKDDFPLSRHQIVILASLIEKETGEANERPTIASVFHNRLKKGMRFESDPTILYGLLRKTGTMPNNIRKKDILEKTEYNTYQLNGFPKGPIANAGFHSLKAVLEPEKTSFYFFVSKNDGTHVFSENFEDHKKAVNLYQKKIPVKK